MPKPELCKYKRKTTSQKSFERRGISFDPIVSSFSRDQNVNHNLFAQIPEAFVLPFLNELEAELHNNLQGLQNCCSTNFTVFVRQTLYHQFIEGRISRFGPIHLSYL